ncbi:MAG: hypothetical protein KGI00_05200 [Candidatus Micrarchaeota archaeon]|nr:hypothetical protein [Candidatus Micrarchaeota archaeon]
MRLQLSLDYLIILSFVLVVFILVFGSIASQRALTSTQQVFSQLQLVAQAVAAQINLASQSGSGYSSSFTLTSALNLPSYNVTITKTGTVIASANISGRIIQAVAYGAAKSIISSDSYLVSGGKAYVLPTLQGGIPIQNSYGNICIDVTCPTIAFQAQNIALNAQTVLAANFNGRTSYISTGTTGLPSGSAARSVFAWVYFNGTPGRIIIYSYGTYAANEQAILDIRATSTGNKLFFAGYNNNFNGSISLRPNTWNFVGYTYASGATSITLYVNGKAQTGSLGAGTALNTVIPTVYPSTIGMLSNVLTTPYSGSISNVQVYSASLSNSSAYQLYQRGVGGSPFTANMVAWWPLDGKANDYSGNGNNGNPVAVSYGTVSQIRATVTNATGAAVSGTLVGFATTIGALANNSRSVSNFTDGNGIASAFLTQANYTGSALVKATAWEGNVIASRNSTAYFTAVKNLVAWWPMNLGYGANVLDTGVSKAFIGNAMTPFNALANLGATVNASWAKPNYVGSFDGNTSYVGIPHSTLINNISNGKVSVSTWVKLPSSSSCISTTVPCYIFSTEAPSGHGYVLAVFQGQAAIVTSGVAWIISNAIVNNSAWHNVVGVWNGSSEYVYVDGALVKTGSAAFSSTPAGSEIGAGCGTSGCYRFFQGQIADVQVYNAGLTAGQVKQIYSQGVSAPPIGGLSLVGWWPLNGDTIDYSQSHLNGSIGGNLRFGPSPIQYAATTSGTQIASFNGINSYIDVGSNPITNFGTGNFTIATWVKTNDRSTATWEGILGKWDGTNGYWLQYTPSSGSWAFGWDGSTYLNPTKSIGDGKWHEVIGMRTGLSKASLYIDGALVGNSSTLPTHSSNGTTQLSIGRLSSGLGRYFNGAIANAQLYNTSLSYPKVSQMRLNGIEGFPISNAIVGWWPLNGDANDYSGHGNSGTPTNVIYSSANQTLFYSNGNYGINLNGQARSYVVQPVNSLTISPGTISMWVYLRSLSDGVRDSTPTFMQSGSAYFALDPSNTIEFWNGASWIRAPTGTLSTNTWYNIAMAYNSSATKLYLNGANVLYSTQTVPAFGNTMYIGARPDAPTGVFLVNGTIADVQVYNTTLTANQIYQNYNNGFPRTASVTVPLGVST